LRVFQTRDETINRNLMTEVKQGEVLNPEDPITQIDMGDRNLAYFNQETLKWMQNADDLTFRYEVVRGERLPAGTPLGSARLAAFMTAAHFNQIQENIALDIKEFLFNVIIPKFEDENTGEHSLRLAGQDLDKIRNLIINQKATDALFLFMLSKKKIPDQKQFEIMRVAIGERVRQGAERLVKIPKDFYKNLKYKIDIIITGEQRDSAVYAATLFAALQAITADPTLLTDPTKKKFFYKWLEQGGISPIDIEPESPMPSIRQLGEQMPAPKGAGGGVSRPVMPATPGMETGERRI